MIYTILSIIVLIAEALVLGIFGYFTIFRKKVVNKKVALYFIPVFFIVYAINLIGIHYIENKITAYDLLNSIKEAGSAFAFEINDKSIASLGEDNLIYFIGAIIAHIMAGITSITTTIAVFRRHVCNFFMVKKTLSGDCDIVIGESNDSVEYAKNNPNTIIWCNKFTKYELENLYKYKVPVIKKEFNPKHIDAKFKKGNRYHFIAFKDTNFSYSQIIDTFSQIKKIAKSIFYLHLEADVSEMEIVKEKYVAKVDKKSNSFVTCFNKYELLARDFIVKHPMSAYVPRDFYDEKQVTIKNDKTLNVALLGFGKVNLKVLEMLVMQNQFVQAVDGKLQPKHTNYYVYDSSKNQLSNEMFIRLQYEFDKISNTEELPKLDKICNITSEPINVKSLEHFESLNKLVDKNSFTYIIVSLGTDLENATFAKKIYDNFNDKGNIKVFARFKENVESLNKNEDEKIIYFGERGEAFTHDLIVNNNLMHISQKVNSLYKKLNDNELLQIQEWEKLSLVKQYANIYNALSIYFKLGMLGYRVCEKDNIPEGYVKINESEYEKKYFENVNKKEFIYQNYFDLNNRNVLAFSEHLRWNAYHYLLGYKPMKLDDVLLVGEELVTQSPYLKLHSCLTTWEGLDKVNKKMLSESLKADSTTKLEEVEVYKYDYMLMDKAYDTLINRGYKIIKEKQK